MNNQTLIVLMAALGICLAINPYTSIINFALFKSGAWFFNGIISRLFK